MLFRSDEDEDESEASTEGEADDLFTEVGPLELEAASTQPQETEV